MLRARGFQRENQTAEIDKMTAVIKRARPRAWLMDSPSFTDLHELLALEAVQAGTLIWEDEVGQAQAFALVDPYCNLLMESAEAANFSALFHESVQWASAYLRQTYSGSGNMPTLDISCRSEDTVRLARIKREGFIAETYQTITLRRDLRAPIPGVTLPAGFHIRPLEGEHELPAYVALHQATFDSGEMTLEMRRAIMRAPEYDRALDLVAVSAVGKLAAFCVCQIFNEENAITGEECGWTDPIGAHPGFQGLGLGLALLYTGFRKLKERGMTHAIIGTRSDNERMLSLARKAGFSIDHTRMWFSKSIV